MAIDREDVISETIASVTFRWAGKERIVAKDVAIIYPEGNRVCIVFPGRASTAQGRQDQLPRLNALKPIRPLLSGTIFVRLSEMNSGTDDPKEGKHI